MRYINPRFTYLLTYRENFYCRINLETFGNRALTWTQIRRPCPCLWSRSTWRTWPGLDRDVGWGPADRRPGRQVPTTWSGNSRRSGLSHLSESRPCRTPRQQVAQVMQHGARSSSKCWLPSRRRPKVVQQQRARQITYSSN